MPGKYPMHPQMPTKGMPSNPTQWVCPYHLVIPHLTLQVQSLGLRLHKYLGQPSVSLAKGRFRDTIARTLFLLTNPIGWSLAMTLKWLQNHSCNIWTQQPSLPLPASQHKDKDLKVSKSKAGMKEVPWGRALTRGRTAKPTAPNGEGNNIAPKKDTRKAWHR